MSKYTDKVENLIEDMWLTLQGVPITREERNKLSKMLDEFKENLVIASLLSEDS